MLNLFKASLLGLLICCLAFAGFGCRKRGGADDEPEVLGDGEFEKTDIEIDEGDWEEPEAVDPELGAVYKTVYFDLDKSVIRAEHRATLEAIADDLEATRGRHVRAVGHCCERGTNEYNFGLGDRRAESVRAYLVALGVQAERIHTLSEGEEKPADPGHDEPAYRKNRRVEFFIVDR
jgi:peptidoglycan-associated lipoprotein